RRRERFECRIGFVDQQWQRGIEQRDVGVQRRGARQRLLEVERDGGKAVERTLRADAAPEIVDGRHRFELFVAIERYCVPGQPVEDRGDAQQSRNVGLDVAAEL